MKKLKLLLLSAGLFLLTACGTNTSLNNPTRFDMWEYMTSSTDYKVQYRVYRNGSVDGSYIEYNRMYGDKFERDSADGITTLFLNSATILMREPLQDVTIDRYVHLKDRDIFRGDFIQSCTLENYSRNYEIKGSIFYNVLMVSCTSMSGVKEEYYYAYNEGLVAMYKNDGIDELEWIKVSETAI